MEGFPTRHPVLRYLAIARAARDFGLGPEVLDVLALCFRADVPGSVDAIADAAGAALLAQPGAELPGQA
jgi:hypothetical protein